MTAARFESEAARKRVVAVAMAVVLAGSLGLSLVVSASGPSFSSLPVPPSWEQRPVPSSVPLRPASSWVDPERPSRRLIAGFMRTRQPTTDLPGVLGETVQALVPLADAPAPTEDQVDVLQTRRLVAARYRGVGEGRNATVGQHLVMVLTNRQGRFTRFFVLYLQDEVPANRPQRLQQNQQLLNELWSTPTVLP